MILDAPLLTPVIASYLDRQRWFLEATAGHRQDELVLKDLDELVAGTPQLYRVILEKAGRHFQVLVGARPAAGWGSLRNEEAALIGAVRTVEGESILYDALFDDELALSLLSLVTDRAESASRVRVVASMVSHAALVYDDRLFMKCYRILEPTPRPEVETLFSLDEIGFNALLAPVGSHAAHGFDVALVREYLPSALEGRDLALTSLRDLLAHAASANSAPRRFDPVVDAASADRAAGLAGGDLCSETVRLGATTARLHLALASAFGTETCSRASLEEVAGKRLEAGEELGLAIRLNGDYHLRRVMRSETGWVIAGFSDDPQLTRRGAGSLTPRFGSPLEDVADMFTSLRVTAAEALRQRPRAEAVTASYLAAAWARRNEAGFLTGYLGVSGIEELLPPTKSRAELLEALSARRGGYEATFSGS